MTKKIFVELVELLEANKGKKVSTLMPQILELTKAKVTSKTFHKDEEGNVVAIYCYFHKQWEAVKDVPYGVKASTASGLNTMCKEGVSQWTKKQRDAKKAKDLLLANVADGTIDASELNEHLEAIEADRTTIIVKGELGFDTLEELLEAV